MKREKRLLVFILIFVFVFSATISSFVFGAPNNSNKAKEKTDKEVKTMIKEDKSQKNKKAFEEKKADENKTLERQEKKSADKEKTAKQDKEERERLKAEIRNNYSNEEMKMLQITAKEIEVENDDINVLPVDSIVAKNKKIKWDIPPVVKSGRILVPVRALTQAFGAALEWNQEEQTVTITKDGKEMVIELNSKTVYVDGVAVELDIPAQSINSRTVVPLRFIAEQLGFKVDFDDETGTVEIDEEDVDKDEDEDEDIDEEIKDKDEDENIDEKIEDEEDTTDGDTANDNTETTP